MTISNIRRSSSQNTIPGAGGDTASQGGAAARTTGTGDGFSRGSTAGRGDWTTGVSRPAPAASAFNPASVDLANVDTDNAQLKSLGEGKLRSGAQHTCVRSTLDNMRRLGVRGPEATGSDTGNNPRGAMVQLVKDQGWKSVAVPGSHEETLKSPYGTARVNVIPAADYERLAQSGQIPSGAVVFQTSHASWNGTSQGSRGYDMALARDGGRTTFNYEKMGSLVYGANTTHVVVLVPGDAVR